MDIRKKTFLGLEPLYDPSSEAICGGDSMKKVLKLLDELLETIIQKIPPYPIDPFPWIIMWIIWIILPLLLMGLI